LPAGDSAGGGALIALVAAVLRLLNRAEWRHTPECFGSGVAAGSEVSGSQAVAAQATAHRKRGGQPTQATADGGISCRNCAAEAESLKQQLRRRQMLERRYRHTHAAGLQARNAAAQISAAGRSRRQMIRPHPASRSQ
jgi:hypothetical protein